jgi:hypothetical protein
VNRATVCRSLVRLESLGELHVRRGGGRGHPNHYQVLLGQSDTERVSPGNPLDGAESVASCDPWTPQNQSHPSTLSTAQKGSHPRQKQSHPRRETVASVDPNRKEPSRTSIRRRAHAQRRHRSLRAAGFPGDQNHAPDSPIPALIAGFCQAHQAALGQPYPPTWGRAGACLKEGTATPSPRFTPHGLRHTYAALHLQHGTDVYYVSRQLGHASIELTVSTYGAWLQPHRRAAVDALDRIAELPAEVEARG